MIKIKESKIRLSYFNLPLNISFVILFWNYSLSIFEIILINFLNLFAKTIFNIFYLIKIVCLNLFISVYFNKHLCYKLQIYLSKLVWW